MNNISRKAAVLAIGLFLVLGSANAAPAGAQVLDPGYGAASIATSVARRSDAKLQRAAAVVRGPVEQTFGKIRQRYGIQ